MKQRLDILNLTMEELTEWLNKFGIKPYRAKQIFNWIYTYQADDFEEMSDLGKNMRSLLSQHFFINRLIQVDVEESVDGSKKYLFMLGDRNYIETVLIPEQDHYTLCISSQVGCAQGCAFCLTAKGGFIRNLSMGEIIAQIRDVENDMPDASCLTNIVIMGMGEPLANYHNIVRALETIVDGNYGLKYSNRRVTLSTVGIVPKLARFGNDISINLAISLNATDNETRNKLMPINQIYPIEQLLQECRNYPLPHRRRITFEYILIKGINDSVENAKRLVSLLRPIKAKVNLIPFNEHDGCDFKRPEQSEILKFQDVLVKRNLTTIIRRSKGEDISAACGQLRVNSMQIST